MVLFSMCHNEHTLPINPHLSIYDFNDLYLIIFRERLDALEKEIRIRSLQRSPGGHSHSHDSAIDSDMYEWETDHVDLDMVIFDPSKSYSHHFVKLFVCSH